MTITCLLSTTFVSTFICSLDLRFPLSCAFTRMRCTAPMTSSCCARNALPSSAAHWMSSTKRLTTSGSAAMDWTLGSQGCFCTASASALSFKVLFFSSHC